MTAPIVTYAADVGVLHALGDRGDERDAEAADRLLFHAEGGVGHADTHERIVRPGGVLIGERDRSGVDGEREIHGRLAVDTVTVHDGIREQLLHQ